MDGPKIMNECLDLTLEKFGMKAKRDKDGFELSTGARSKNDHIKNLAGVLALQCELFRVALVLNQGVTKDSNIDRVSSAKRLFDHMNDVTEGIFNHHIDSLVEDRVSVTQVKGNE